jgi:uncharacterized membrane protein YedE/YeeE
MGENVAAGAVAWAALALGVVAGAVLQRSHFCTMGCVSDAVLFGSFRRARVWALALATALLGSQALDGLGLVDLGTTAYRSPAMFWLGALLGGGMFGFGMVLAGGCVSRNLVRLGGGSLKALTTLLVMAVAAYATTAGVLAPLHAGLRSIGAVDLARDQGLPALLASLTGLGTGLWAAALTVAIAGAALVFCFRDPAFRRARDEIATGMVLGSLVPAGWLVTGWLGAGAGASPPLESLTYVGPVGGSLLFLMTGSGGRPGFGVALVAGTILGAAAVALQRRQFRLETFVARDDMVRHLVGGSQMGCGGALALGCTVGQGLTGAATLGLGSWLALAAILAGGAWGVNHLLTGRLAPPLPAFARRRPEALDTSGLP